MRLSPDDLVVREIDGEVVMLSLGQAIYYSANRAGALLVERLLDGADRSALVGVLVDRYAVSELDAARDVDAFLDQLREHELLVEP